MSKVKLLDFNNFEVKLNYQEIIDKYANECCVEIKRTAPVKSGTYAEGWTTQKTGKKAKGESKYGVTVYNATSYQLTHLLENGHIVANKIGGVGWASPKPHIDPAFQSVKEPFIRAMENVKIDVDIK